MIVTGDFANSMTPVQVRQYKSAADIVDFQLHSSILGYLKSLVVRLHCILRRSLCNIRMQYR